MDAPGSRPVFLFMPPLYRRAAPRARPNPPAGQAALPCAGGAFRLCCGGTGIGRAAQPARKCPSRRDELTRLMAQAVAVEDYETAAQLRDELRALQARAGQA